MSAEGKTIGYQAQRSSVNYNTVVRAIASAPVDTNRPISPTLSTGFNTAATPQETPATPIVTANVAKGVGNIDPRTPDRALDRKGNVAEYTSHIGERNLAADLSQHTKDTGAPNPNNRTMNAGEVMGLGTHAAFDAIITAAIGFPPSVWTVPMWVIAGTAQDFRKNPQSKPDNAAASLGRQEAESRGRLTSTTVITTSEKPAGVESKTPASLDTSKAEAALHNLRQVAGDYRQAEKNRAGADRSVAEKWLELEGQPDPQAVQAVVAAVKDGSVQLEDAPESVVVAMLNPDALPEGLTLDDYYKPFADTWDAQDASKPQAPRYTEYRPADLTFDANSIRYSAPRPA